jgi:hypothetical protein
MASRSIDAANAPEVFLMYWDGVYVSRICARFDVDPRRVYDILRGRKHSDAKSKALARLWDRNPALAAEVSAGLHEPKPETRLVRKTAMEFGG